MGSGKGHKRTPVTDNDTTVYEGDWQRMDGVTLDCIKTTYYSSKEFRSKGRQAKKKSQTIGGINNPKVNENHK